MKYNKYNESINESSMESFPLWVIKATFFLSSGSGAFISRFINVYFYEKGMTPMDLGFINLAGALSNFVGSQFWGIIADKYGSLKLVFLISFLFSSGLTMLYPFISVFRTYFGFQISKFRMYLGLNVIVMFFSASQSGVLDAVAIKAAEAQGESYGQQRLWRAISWGSFSFVAGMLIDRFGFIVMFLGYASLQLINIILILIFFPNYLDVNAETTSDEDLEVENPKQGLCTIETILFFINIFIYFTCANFVERYLLVYLQDYYDAPKMLMGMAIWVMTLGELPLYYFSENIMDRFGIRVVIIFCMLLYPLRVLIYTIIPTDKPWYFLAVEPTHGITFALCWAASVQYAKEISPPGYHARMQSITNGIVYALAASAGCALGGYIYHHYGAHYMWYLGAAAVTGWGQLYALFLTCLYCRRKIPDAPEPYSPLASPLNGP